MRRFLIPLVAAVLALVIVGEQVVAQISSGTVNIRTLPKGSTTAGNPTSTAVDSNTQALDVSVKGTATISGTVTANQGGAPWSVNKTQIGGVAVSTGNGVVGTGVQRVAIASDNSAFGVNLAQYTPVSGRLPVDGSGVTQPVSGTVTANAGTGTFTVNQIALTTIVSGQQAVTASAVALPSNSAGRVCVKVLASGTQTVYFGPSGVTTSTGQELSPGDSWCGPVSNTNKIFVIAGSTGSTVAFDALN